MTKQIEPVEMWCAVRPDGTLAMTSLSADRDVVALFVSGMESRLLRPVDTGWTVRRVEIRVKEEG